MKDMQKLIDEKVMWYETRGNGAMTEMMLNEVEAQFIDMAKGGDGSSVGNGEIRVTYYKSFPVSFFQRVCDAMGWKWQ